MLIVNTFIGFIRLKKHVNKANMACKYITCNGVDNAMCIFCLFASFLVSCLEKVNM